MERIGVRELRQNASVYLRRVQAGETIGVTDRGRLMARLTPVTDDGWDQLVAEGRLRPAIAPLADLGALITLPRGQEPPSACIARMRDE